MRRKNIIFIILLIIIAFTYIVLRKENINAKYRLMIIEKDKWKLLDIESYEYIITTDSNGYTVRYDSRIIVKNNNFDSEIQNNEDKHSIQRFNDYKYLTIDNIYNYLEDLFNYYKNEKINIFYTYDKSISIEYDLNYHIPIEIIIKSYKFPLITDIPTWSSIRIKNFMENVE